MKKYLITASLFLFNAEIVSWVALLAIVVMAVADFAKAADREANNR